MPPTSQLTIGLVATLGFATASVPAHAIDKFDVQVCEASPRQNQIACFEDLKIQHQCSGLPQQRALDCLRAAAASAVAEDERRKRPVAPPPLPFTLNLRGANWKNTVTVDADCIYRATPSASDGPELVHLSQVNLVFVTGLSQARLACKGNVKCAIASYRVSVRSASEGTYEAKTDSLTVLGDYGDRNESQSAIDGPLRRAVDYCQKVAQSEGWKARLAKAR